jgi:outer membrane protein OmpA-like peptidoglycan-associated protein
MHASRLALTLALGISVFLPRVASAQAEFDDFDADFGGAPTTPAQPARPPQGAQPPAAEGRAGATPTDATDTDGASAPPAATPSEGAPAPSEGDFFDVDSQGATFDESAPAQAAPAGGAPEAAPAVEGEEAPGADEAPAPAEDEAAAAAALDRRLFLEQNSFYGPMGGIHAVDAGGGAVGTFRLALMTDFFFINGFIVPGDHQEHIGGALSLSWTPHRLIEVYGALRSYANSNTTGDPELLQVLGDAFLGLKIFGRITPTITIGGDLTMGILNTVGGIGVVGRSTSGGARFNFTTDLRGRARPIPFVFRFNAQYWFDNSSNLVRDVERARYQNLPDPAPFPDEARNLVTTVERFGLMLNRTDFVNFALGFEAPFQPSEKVLVSPIVEWTWGVPVNRQGYNCLLVPGSPGSSHPAPGQDGCLDTEGMKAFPMNLTVGLRLQPAVRGLGIVVGADIGLTGTRTFVRELSPNAPYAVILGASYAYDPTPPVVEAAVEEPPPPAPEPAPLFTAARIHGTVVSGPDEDGQGGGAPVGGAVVAFTGRDLNSLIANAGGGFVTYRFRPGEQVTMDVTHPDYMPGQCVATIPEAPMVEPEAAPPATPGAPAEAPSAPEPEAASGKQDAAAPAEEAAPEAPADSTPATPAAPAAQAAAEAEPAATRLDENGDLIIELRCELPPKPRAATLLGKVVDAEGAPVAGAAVQITGPQEFTVTSEPDGTFRIPEMEPGTYTARIEQEGFLLKMNQFSVEPRADAEEQFTLIPRPRRSLVRVTARQIVIRRQVNFATDSAEILVSSDPLLTEVADALLRNPEIRLVEIQGHTDDRGGAAHNMRLSQERAEAVRTWLIEHGIAPERLEARGFGSSQPLVPNITAANRARNRRVQFVIKDRDRGE